MNVSGKGLRFHISEWIMVIVHKTWRNFKPLPRKMIENRSGKLKSIHNKTICHTLFRLSGLNTEKIIQKKGNGTLSGNWREITTPVALKIPNGISMNRINGIHNELLIQDEQGGFRTNSSFINKPILRDWLLRNGWMEGGLIYCF